MMTKAAIVKRRDGKWVLLTKDSSRVLGTHESAQDAYKQEYAIEKSKERQKSASPEASPTPAQIDSGNYKKDHLKVHGLSVTIENLKGSTRRGIEHGGNRWSVKMPCDYGYIRGFTGNDGDGVDCYVGPNTDSYMVYVVSQRNLSTGRFDEHKCMLGFKKKEQAVATYLKGFSDGAGIRRLMGVKSMPIPQFKEWLSNKSNMKKQASSAKDRLKVKVAELYKTKGYTEPMQKAKDVQPKQAPIKFKKLQTYTATQAPSMPKLASAAALDMVAKGLIGLIKQSQAQTPSLPPPPTPMPTPALKAPAPTAPTYKDPFTEIPRIAHEEVQQSIDMGNWGSSEEGNAYSKSQYGLAPHQLSNNQYDLLKSHYINNVRQAPAPAPAAVDRPIPMPQGPQVSDFMMGGRYFGKTPAQVQAQPQQQQQVPMAPATAPAPAPAPAPVISPAVSNTVATSPVIEAQKNRQYAYDTDNTVRTAISQGPAAFAAVASTMLPEQLMKYKSMFENELRTNPKSPNKDNLKRMLEIINAHGRLSIADQSSPNKNTTEGVMA